MAFLLASARHAGALLLGLIRSLHYFLCVIEELLATPLPHRDAYLAYLRNTAALPPTAGRPPASNA